MARYEYHLDLGNGKAEVHARSEGGHPFTVIVWRDKVGTEVMYLAMAARERTVDKEVAAIAAHQSRGVS